MLMRHLLRRGLLTPLVLCAMLTPSVAMAQELAARVSGVVREQGGHPLPGARVTFVPGGAATITDSGGRFTLSIPPRESGTLTVQRLGFEAAAMAVPSMPDGTRRDIAITLTGLARLDVVSVIASRARPLLDTRNATTGGAIEREELEHLPTDARDPIALGYNIPGVAQATGFFGDAPRLTVNGANSLYTQYTLDGLDNNEGFLGGPRVEVPLSALARFAVQANTYGAELGRSSNGVVTMESRAGEDRWTGEAFAYDRPGIPVDAKAAVVPNGENADDFRRAQQGFRRSQFGGAAGGPLRRAGADGVGTYAFGALEYTDENEDRVNSTARATFLGRELRKTYKVLGRLDHGWSPTQTTTLRVAASSVNRAGEGTGIVAPEADITVQRIGSLSALTHRSALRGGRASNEASVQLGTFRWNYPPTRSSFDVPQVTIAQVQPNGNGGSDTVDVGIVGSSNFVFDEHETQLQLRDVFETRARATHTIRGGVDATRSAFRLTGSSTNPSGSYRVLNEGNIPRLADGRYRLADVPASVRVLSYTVDAAQKQVDLEQSLVGAFVEDQWRATPALTVTAGLRWDYDDLTSRGNSSPDLNNIQPRLSLNWLPGPNTVLRGGAGVYTGKLPYTIYSDAIQFGPNGNQTVTFQGAQAPAFGQGPRTATLDRSQLPPGEIRELFALGIQDPTSYQYTIGWQHQFGDRVGLSVDGVIVNTFHLPRSWDLNPDTRGIGPADTVSLPPSAGDAFRPVPPATGSYRRHTTSESGGRSTYRGIYTSARYRATGTLLLDANYVWSHARNNTEDINFNATQGNDFDREWADAVNDRRHKATVRATYTGVRRLTLAGIADLQSGQPINRIAYFRDLDGSGDTFGNGFLGNQDRFYGVPRNGERLPNAFLIHASLGYSVPVPATGGQSLEARADVFNLLNSTIRSGYANGIPGGGARTQVGRPGDPIVYSSAGAPRQVQFSLRYAF
ncbi:MAG: TonB-dependent receptor [Gemmatimonadaceae bacterium]|nr:TonB-dependent receptor [Gemmatimonadaceae bacterium]